MVKSYKKKVGIKEDTKEPIFKEFWEFRVRYIDDDGTEKQKHLKNFKTKRECENTMKSFLGSKWKNTKREGLNFEHLFNEYKRVVWTSLRPSTRNTNSCWFNNHILPYFRNFLVCNIKVMDVIDFQNKLKVEKKLKDNSVRNISRQLKSFLNYCRVQGYITDIPFDRRRTSVTIRDDKEVTIWGYDEFKQFVKFYDDDIDKKTVFYILFFTGMRIEELLGLEKRDFDLDNNTLSIRRTFQRIGGVDYLEEITKTPSSRRKNYMGSILVNVVKEFFYSHPNLKEDERLFPTTQRTVYRWMKKGCDGQGVPFTHPHSLRNSLITNGISSGINPKSLSVYVGHSSPRTTLDVYTKSVKKDEVEIGNLYQEPQKLIS